eukprot:2765626-Amphidinium_carterae.1
MQGVDQPSRLCGSLCPQHSNPRFGRALGAKRCLLVPWWSRWSVTQNDSCHFDRKQDNVQSYLWPKHQTESAQKNAEARHANARRLLDEAMAKDGKLQRKRSKQRREADWRPVPRQLGPLQKEPLHAPQ